MTTIGEVIRDSSWEGAVIVSVSIFVGGKFARDIYAHRMWLPLLCSVAFFGWLNYLAFYAERSGGIDSDIAAEHLRSRSYLLISIGAACSTILVLIVGLRGRGRSSNQNVK